MGSKANYAENAVLDHLLAVASTAMPAGVYSALFTVIPSDSTGGTEVTTTDSSYTRVLTTMGAAGATTTGLSENSGAVSFATVTAGDSISVVGWGLLDAATAGNLLYWATVVTTVLQVGDQATFPATNIAITED
jgi:hypothetical protein